LAEKLPMQPRHPAIRNDPDGNGPQSSQISSFRRSQLQAAAQDFHRVLLEIGNIDRDSSLKITHANFRNCHSERSEESLIVAAGQTKTIIRNVSLRST